MPTTKSPVALKVAATSCANHKRGETGYCSFNTTVPHGAKLVLQSEAAAQVLKLSDTLEEQRCTISGLLSECDTETDGTSLGVFRTLVSRRERAERAEAELAAAGERDYSKNPLDGLKATITNIQRLGGSAALDELRAIAENPAYIHRDEQGELNAPWQPIVSAPRDGTYILVVDEEDVSPPFVTCWRTFKDGFGKVLTGFVDPDYGELGPDLANPTHWAPLVPLRPPAKGRKARRTS